MTAKTAKMPNTKNDRRLVAAQLKHISLELESNTYKHSLRISIVTKITLLQQSFILAMLFTLHHNDMGMGIHFLQGCLWEVCSDKVLLKYTTIKNDHHYPAY